MRRYLPILLLLAACSNSTTTMNGGYIPPPDPNAHTVTSYVGHALYWTDVVGEDDTAHVTAVWTKALDSSWAVLRITPDSGARDSIFLRRDSLRWHFDAKDPRQSTGWDPYVTETRDSLYFDMGFGFSGTDYLLRKE